MDSLNERIQGGDSRNEDKTLKKLRGFTLIELLIVLVVIAILAAIALPAYDSYVRKTRRAQAKADMLEISHMLEREFTLNRSYLGFDELANNRSPRIGTIYYNITYNPATTASTYSIVATPVGGQANDTQCLVLGLNNLGVRTATGSLGPAGCW